MRALYMSVCRRKRSEQQVVLFEGCRFILKTIASKMNMNFDSPFSKFLSFLSLLSLFTTCNAYEYGVLAAGSDTGNHEFCLYVESAHYTYPKQKSVAEPHILQNDEEIDWCMNTSTIDSTNKVLLLPAGNCSTSAQVHNFFHMGGKVVIFVQNGSLDDMDFNESEDLNEMGLPVVKISKHSAKMLKEMGKTVTVHLFQPDGLGIKYFIAVTWSLAMLTITICSYWSGLISYEIFNKKILLNHSANSTRSGITSRIWVTASSTGAILNGMGVARITATRPAITTDLEAATTIETGTTASNYQRMLQKFGIYVSTDGHLNIFLTPYLVIFFLVGSATVCAIIYFLKNYLRHLLISGECRMFL
ncbi:signal peptide peptidase-like 2B [Nephila pilipes]|uniref:Signal peptide peptidase-like 2B n=1 Tax=Nephila pilipes TaxID=299642 RepID=A0A8X6P8Z2_NEPPI|nr:signal peptide peptidase-like 2B [Nephila pilipes]